MATWVTHLMIADGVLKYFPGLDKRGFCVGNIAPDCNVENADWTAFTPSREVTHWMQGERKKASDCDAFCEKYIINRRNEIQSPEEFAFLLGYYAHLITDAAFQTMIRDENRVEAVWRRIKADPCLSASGAGMAENWDSVKQLISRRDRMREIYAMEAQYLSEHPNSGYLTEILLLKEFPDYIDYLPSGAVVRKIGVMGYLPKADDVAGAYIAISKEEYGAFVKSAICEIVRKFRALGQFSEEMGDYRIIPYDEKYRDDMIFMVLQAKDALGRIPGLNEDLLDVQKNYIDTGDMFWLAIDAHDRVIGCIGYHAIPGTTEARLHRLYIKAERKRQGIGTQLLYTVERYLREQGKTATHVHLGGKEYFESRCFYPKHGYTEYAPDFMKKEL